MFTLKITGLTAQRDMEQLVRVLLRVPGLSSQQVSVGLKMPPFHVLSVEHENQAMTIKSTLEKFGAICVVENTSTTAIPKKRKDMDIGKIAAEVKENKRKFMRSFWLAMLAIVVVLVVAERAMSGAFSFESNEHKPHAQAQAQKPAKTEKPPTDLSAKNKNDLKSDLSKNPYNTGAWKSLYERLDKEGDTAAARQAKESYEKALRAQQVLASLAKAFGNNSRVEIAEDAVYYRTSKDLTDSEFYYEAEKLRDSLNTRFPAKDLVLENFKPDNTVQSIRLKSAYVTK